MLRPLKIEIQGVLTPLMCLHWRMWPPLAVTALGRTPEGLRDSHEIDQNEYQRIKVWERVCGLREMDAGKCLKCPLVRRVEYRGDAPFLISLDGTKVSKAREGEIEGMGRPTANLKFTSGRTGRARKT